MRKNMQSQTLLNGYQLFYDTFKLSSKGTISNPSKNLAAIAYAFSQSDVLVHGQEPDKNYPVAAYFVSGSRIMFDLHELNIKEQNEFWELLFEKEKDLKFRLSSHRISGTTPTNNPAEISLKLTGKTIKKNPLIIISFLYNIFSQIFTRSQSGMNIAVGGEGTKINEEIVDNNGKNGHVLISTSRGFFHSWFSWLPWSSHYLSRTGNAFMVGIENSAPGKKNIRTHRGHNINSDRSDISAFLLPKIGSEALSALQHDAKVYSLSGEHDGYNWVTAKVTPKTLKSLRDKNVRNKPEEILGIINTPPKNSIFVDEKNAGLRTKASQNYQQLTQKTSNTLKWAVWGATLFTVVGIALCFIPGFQPIGGLLSYMGIHTLLSLPATLSIAGSIGMITGMASGTVVHTVNEGTTQQYYKKSLPIVPKPVSTPTPPDKISIPINPALRFIIASSPTSLQTPSSENITPCAQASTLSKSLSFQQTPSDANQTPTSISSLSESFQQPLTP
jgi:hypothetical protein